MKKLFVLISLVVPVNSIADSRFEVNDVSILYDLPKDHEALDLLIGAKKLIPKKHFDEIKPLIMGHPGSPKDEYASLRVIGVRIDPCFTYTNSPKCFPQLRLVWQPVGKVQGKYTTFDAGLHTFHGLNPADWKSVLRRIKALKLKMESLGVSTKNTPLGIHPALKNPETKTVFELELAGIIQDYATAKTLSRITFMKLFTRDIWWVFGGFDIKNGRMVKMTLPRHSEKEDAQNFFNTDFNAPVGMKGAFTPELVNTTKKNDLSELLKDFSYTFSTPEGRVYVKESLGILDRIENPKFFTPETIDCAHCHVAAGARAYLNDRDTKFYQANQKTAFRYSGSGTQNTSESLANSKTMRMFGYFGSKTSLAQRVINESAEVARLLNQNQD